MKCLPALGLWALLSLVCNPLCTCRAAPLGTAFTYQGRLDDGSNPANGSYDLRFTIYDSTNTPGNVIAGPITKSATAVSNGLFCVTLDFGSQFNGEARWLEIGVRTNGGSSFTTLTPRQALTPAPYALFAPNAGTAASAAFATSANIANGMATGSVGNTALQANAVTSGKIADGTIVAGDLSPTLRSNTFWRLNGNNAGAGDFVGTTGNQPLEFRVNNQVGLRLEPTTNGVPNVIGGDAGNYVAPGVSAATIGGGGGGGSPQLVAGGGGTVGGGVENEARGMVATVGGGQGNVAGGVGATVSGGAGNTIQTNADFGTIPGGGHNTVAAPNGFAAGWRAKANHRGTFVWADSTDTDFASTRSNQFLIRASGGVGIGTNNPQSALQVAGMVTANAFNGDGAGLVNVNGSALQPGSVSGSALANHAVTTDKIAAGAVANANISAAGIDAGKIIGGDLQAARLKVGSGQLLGGAWATIAGGSNNVATGDYSAVGGGVGNTANGPLAFVGGGSDNKADWNYDTVAGGSENRAATWYGTVGGGLANLAGGYATTIGGGSANVADNDGGVVVGGESNTNSGYDAAIGGGLANHIADNASYATIGGGHINTIPTNAIYSTIGGGWNNLAGYCATVGGGTYNGAFQDWATISGGRDNKATGVYAAVAGGWHNVASGPGSVVGGGGWDDSNVAGNIAGGEASTIAGGWNNNIKDYVLYATIGGGGQNSIEASAHDSCVSGGYANTIETNAQSATIGGGTGNTILPDAQFATIAGGGGNRVDAPRATVVGGHSAVARNYGQWAYASGLFYKPGDAQASLYILRGETVSNRGYQELFLDGNQTRLRVPTNSVWAFHILVVGDVVPGGSESDGFEVTGLIANSAGHTVLLAPPTITKLGGDSYADFRVEADPQSDAFLLEAQAPGVPLGYTPAHERWVARVETVEFTP